MAMPDVLLATHVQQACILEATARKPGNVTRFHDFDDVTYLDFLLSAAAIAPAFANIGVAGVGRTILEAIRATRTVVRTNTNLGIVLLLAPLAAVPHPLGRQELEQTLDSLTVDDSRCVFEAIRLANPGGLGHAPREDVHAEATLPLRQVMALAADRDSIARQYVHGFRDVFELGLPCFDAGPLEAAIIRCHVTFMARMNDSHIVRRCGAIVAEEARRRAQGVLSQGCSDPAVAELDAWLRADGHRRNPGTSADLTTAALFVALRSGKITFPVRFR